MMSLPVWLPGPMFSLGVLCPWSHVPLGGLCPGVSVWRSLCSGGVCPGGVSVERHPPESKKQTVRILLECFLVCCRLTDEANVIIT